MRIIPCSDERMGQAEFLVRSVFRGMTHFERFSFIAIRNPKSLAGRLLMYLAGVKDKVAFDVCVDEADVVLGTTGLYRYKKDFDEAVWLAWVLCRSQGKGAWCWPSADGSHCVASTKCWFQSNQAVHFNRSE